MNAQHNEMTMDEMDQVNGGVVLLVIVAAWKPSPARKGRTKVEIHQKSRQLPGDTYIPGDMYYPNPENLLPAVQLR
jgi:hypothetical protein